ncbi:MAG: radical SAM protein [Gammaproteobacteria bacterium]|nr:radical SAM protein [Gammaproteobacteria bacterium]
MNVLRWFSRRAQTADERSIIRGPFTHLDGSIWRARGVTSGGDHQTGRYASQLKLYENGEPMLAAHQPYTAIQLGGEGRYNHWESDLLFSTSDGSDPNTNGRTYSYDLSLDYDTWEHARLARAAKRWHLHPGGAAILAGNGRFVPPPLIANLGLTNKCNLRCDICGSQKHLDNAGVRRRHMSFDVFNAVAETLFPMLSVVELNSQGDPLLYPRIESVLETVARHGCEIKIQHNGTLLVHGVVDLVLQQYGTIMLSLDAVGPKFDEVRRGGVWSKAEPGLRRLLSERNPGRLSVGVYPTLTGRTIGEAINTVRWCAENDVDCIGFHRYMPVAGSTETAPTEAEYQAVCDEIRRWLQAENDPLRVQFEGDSLNSRQVVDRKNEYADVRKAVAYMESGKVMFPTRAGESGADPLVTCAAPDEYVEIGLEGQIGVCCRSQDVALGHATSIEEFAAVWLGANYDLIRRSLKRGEKSAYPLPNCAECVKFFAPDEAVGRSAVDYVAADAAANEGNDQRLQLNDQDVILLETVQKESGFCHISVFPLGIAAVEYELWEDDLPLGPGGTLHDAIRQHGGGRFHVGANAIYFSTSDGSDARRNGRVYTLRRVATDNPFQRATVTG